MSGTRPSSPTPAEHHLGDRLAALVDGELGHDSRERVLAHLATCARCKAEADAQRTLKSVFASAAPPPPSEGFLARLQGLPGGPGDPGAPGGPSGPLEQLLGTGGLKSDGFAARGTRSGERSGAQAVDAGQAAPLSPGVPATLPHGPVAPRGPMAAVNQGTVPAGAVPPDAVRSAAAPLSAVRLQRPAPQSLLPLSPFIRPTGPALQLAFAPGPGPVSSPTTAPLGSHR